MNIRKKELHSFFPQKETTLYNLSQNCIRHLNHQNRKSQHKIGNLALTKVDRAKSAI